MSDWAWVAVAFVFSLACGVIPAWFGRDMYICIERDGGWIVVGPAGHGWSQACEDALDAGAVLYSRDVQARKKWLRCG